MISEPARRAAQRGLVIAVQRAVLALGLIRSIAQVVGDPLPVSDALVLPNETNAVQFRLYTNASPQAPHLFNTIEINGYGEKLLTAQPSSLARQEVSVHNLLVNGSGPELLPENGARTLTQASGQDWLYVLLDLTSSYRRSLSRFTRGVLFVAPDLFVLFDDLAAKEPAYFEFVLHPPAATQIDNAWGDLRLDLASAALTIHAPGQPKHERVWRQTPSPADLLLPHTITTRLGPTNRLSELQLLTVFVVQPQGERKELAFKLLESHTAIGARIYRSGLPTFVAFNTSPTAENVSVAGFAFTGPVAVSVFKPKSRAAAP